MAVPIDQSVFEELASILKGMNPFLNLNEFDFDTCQGFKKDSTIRCGNRPRKAEEQEEFADLLSELSAMTKYVDTNSLYDKMERFIALTHCTGRHLKEARTAFSKWKAQRKIVAPDSPPMTSSGSATPYTSSSESLPHHGNMNFPSAVPASPGHKTPALESITEKIRGLNIGTAAQKSHAKKDSRSLDGGEAQIEKLERIGVAHMPKRGEEHNNFKIHHVVRNPLDAKVMSGGILYVLKHTEVPGIFKIGFSSTSADLRLKQSRNCYKRETSIIHETQGGKFFGARQAERVAHAILRHKRILFFRCPQCKGYHKEWFLVSRQEALEVVELAERWLKMSAYTLQEGQYKLTPEGDTISQIMFPFSMSKWRVLINKVDKLDDHPGAFSDATPAASIRETSAFNVSSAATEKETPRVIVDEVHASKPSQGNHPQEEAPLTGVSNKGATYQVEYEEICEERERRSRETTPEGNYLLVKEKIIRKKVSINNMGHNNGASSSQFDVKIKDQAGEAVVEIREVHAV
ncbi:hypothetical protein GGI35DRAFT_447833 [Trichoderma velutinum]